MESRIEACFTLPAYHRHSERKKGLPEEKFGDSVNRRRRGVPPVPSISDPIDPLLALDPHNRGIKDFFRPGGAFRAAASLLRSRRVLMTTGFAVGQAMPETDGPPGTVVLGRALRLLGKSVTYLTDPVTLPIVEAALKALGEPIDVVAVPPGPSALEDARRLVASFRPTHLVAVERPGRTRDGDYLSARGESVAEWNAPLDDLFLARRRGVKTIGIGDGGNEIGMGNVRAALVRRGPLAKKIASIVTVDYLVVAGTSNWGAYGVAVHLSRASGLDLLHTVEDERRLLAACVDAGAVDGLTRRNEPSVDGLPGDIHEAVVRLLRSLLECGRSARRVGRRP
jgi:hypothetical protein